MPAGVGLEFVVVAAEWDEIAGAGFAAVVVGLEVVEVALLGGAGAAGEAAGAVDGDDFADQAC